MAARDVKTPQEIELLKINGAIGDAMLRDFEDAIRPGIREYELLATLTDSLLRHQGEYLFTRLVSSGRNTNPWGSEARDKIVMPGDLVAVDTDAYGYEGYMIDVSRTFLCGDVPVARPDRGVQGRARGDGGDARGAAARHVVRRVRPGRAGAARSASRRSSTSAWCTAPGLEDESPTIYYPGQAPNPTGRPDRARTWRCASRCTSARWAASYGVKLEDEVLVTERGAEPLCTYPYDPTLLGL